MKITLLSEKDYAASGYKLYEALKEQFDIQFFAGHYANKFDHPQRNPEKLRTIQRRINESDIVHLKGDFPPHNGYMGLKIMHKPIVVSVSGSHFRKKQHGGHGYYHISQYDKATIKTAFTPDLCYPEYSTIWTPHPINSHIQSMEWSRAVHPVLVHSPTNRGVKDTAFVEAVFHKLAKRMKIETIIIENEPYENAVRLRKEATIFFDQFKVGFYGNSAIEAMQYGVPVAAWISPQAAKQANGSLDGCPVITEVKSVDAWARKIEQVIDGDLQTLSIKTKRWCNYMHSYQAVAKQWESIYNAV